MHSRHRIYTIEYQILFIFDIEIIAVVFFSFVLWTQIFVRENVSGAFLVINSILSDRQVFVNVYHIQGLNPSLSLTTLL